MAVNIDYRVVAMLYVSMCKTNSKICVTYDFKLSNLNLMPPCTDSISLHVALYWLHIINMCILGRLCKTFMKAPLMWF